MDVAIRTAAVDDISAISHVLITTWHDTYDASLGKDRVTSMAERWHSAGVLARRLEAQDGLTLVALNGATIVATAHGFPRGAECLWLSQLYVLPGHQRRGLGGALLARLIAAYPAAALVELEVAKANAKAVAFYARAGFEPVGERDECLGSIALPTLILRRYVPPTVKGG